MITRQLIIFIFSLSPLFIRAQIQITSGITPVNLVQNVLLGNGVSATNITFTGNPNQIGKFNGVNSTIGLDSGIVLGSGDVNQIPTPSPSMDYNGPGDPDLLTVAQSVTTNPQAGQISSTNDAAILEFDFVPQGDTVNFNFVFASEEYLGFVNTSYNDVFGFFLSGPGITGPFAAPAAFPNGSINLASVPGVNPPLPITISTIYPPFDYDFDGNIDPGFNDQYYINNPNNNTHGLNGFTTPLTIGFDVICGETYHFKFAVADCGDGTLDTHVFFEAGSFESPVLIDASLDTQTGDSVLIEGCTNAMLTITRPLNQAADSLELTFALQGVALDGVDYTVTPNQILFLPGQETVTLTFETYDDGLTEGPESIFLTINIPTACGLSTITDTLYILDPPVADFTASPLSGCAPLSVTFTNSSTNSNQFFWDFGDGTTQTANTLAQQQHTFNTSSEVLMVASYNNLCLDSSMVEITVFQSPVIVVNSPSICEGDTALLVATGANTYTWSPSLGSTNAVGDSNYVSPSVTTTYVVTGTDLNGCTSTASALVSVELVEITVNNDSICANVNSDQAVLTASGAATYVWSPSNGLNTTTGATVLASPLVTTSYLVTGTSQNGCVDTAVAIVTVIPDFNLTVTTDSICAGESATLVASGATTYTWSPGTYLNTTTGSNVIASPPQTTTYTVLGKVGSCEKSVNSTLIVYPKPNAIINASDVELTLPETLVTLMAGEQGNQNTWTYGNEVISTQPSFDYELPLQPGGYKIDLLVENEFGCTDETSVIIQLIEDLVFYVPNSFTPDGDEFNNVFLPILTSGMDISTYKLALYNRWGEVVFETSDVSIGWDGTYHGKLCQNGVYTWLLTFKSKYTDRYYEFNGHVSIQP
jgi:gliding motility-associated-like protein